MHPHRLSGILLHPTSLPGPGGIGTFGSEARRFVDFLREARQSLWQILPLGPTGYGNSPYSCYSAFAGNPLLIDLADLVGEGDLTAAEVAAEAPPSGGRLDYPAVIAHKLPLLKRAAARFLAGDDLERKREFWQFCDTTFWLHDYALFMAAKEHFKGKGWARWPEPLSRRTPEGIEKFSRLLGPDIGEQKYLQWQFARQWQSLRAYAGAQGVKIIGDAPIFVAYDSADVWCNRPLFQLDAGGRPTVVAGVPPDYFSTTGQLWGNPLYDWQQLSADNFGWWVARLRNDLTLYDMVRIDHFRGFAACWAVPAGQKTAVKGSWQPGPGEKLFTAFRQALGKLPIIAEDLGVITPDVEELRDRFQLPGMRILQFAFDSGPANAYLPHNYQPNCVAYTGTHDNDTTAGWFAALDERQRRRVLGYLRCDEGDVVRELVRAVFASVAAMAIVPLQDILELDTASRMNVPGVAGGNWGWRCAEGSCTAAHAEFLRSLAEMYNRNGQ